MAVFHEVLVVFDGESEERLVNERAICVPVGAEMKVGEKYAVKWRGGSTFDATIVRIIEHKVPEMEVSNNYSEAVLSNDLSAIVSSYFTGT